MDKHHTFRIKPGERVRLGKRDPGETMRFPDKKEAKRQSHKDAEAIGRLQDRLYAEGSRALLIILQGTDTSGKDGTIRHVLNETGPLGVTVAGFRKPSEEELAHDFLWRVHHACPRRGHLGIFNRSHYEDVLVPLVRGTVDPAEIAKRYQHINDFEKMLVETGTTVLKFFLHIPKDEQGRRLQDRIEEPNSRWKFDPGDLVDRQHWAQFQDAYERVLTRCSTAWAPWYIIPADHKWARNAAVAAIIRATLEAMDPQYPTPAWDPESVTVT